MKKAFLSLFLSITAIFACFAAGCDKGDTPTSSEEPKIEKVDYVSSLKLDMDSNSAKITINPVKANGNKSYTHIDGDTTHFDVPTSINEKGTVKARYLAVDTPESTGDIEEWGKAASAFTKDKLANASSIILESNPDHWTFESNDRYLAWVWYKPKTGTDYRLLNLELLQEGLAVESNGEDARYRDVCSDAADQARKLKLHIYSDEKDPDFYYGSAIKTTLKEVRTNLTEFIGKRVAVHGLVSVYAGQGSIYVQEYDETDDKSYGLPVFYGYGNSSYDPVLAPGNEVRIVGEVTYSETFGYQISGLKYNFMDPTDEESIKCFSKKNPIAFPEATVAEFVADNYAFAKASLYGTISMKNLKVLEVYTTKEGDSKGAMTFTCCQGDDETKKIDIRTTVMKDPNGNLITAEMYEGKTIDVKGIVEEFSYQDNPIEYQINVFSRASITLHD